MSGETEKSKIIIDEDWKSQVQAEKEAAKTGHAPVEATATSAGSSATESSSAGETDSPVVAGEKPASKPADFPDADMPPASLLFLCTTLATQAMIALGQVPNPITGKTELRLKQAKHYIDTLGMLEEKTKGNRTADESALFDDILHQMRMAYVALSR
jgi:hypothetical protein